MVHGGDHGIVIVILANDAQPVLLVVLDFWFLRKDVSSTHQFADLCQYLLRVAVDDLKEDLVAGLAWLDDRPNDVP